MTEWQPIGTAPKAGVFIGFKMGDYVEAIYCVSWIEKKHLQWRNLRGDVVNSPTHWMPLPDLPTTSPVIEAKGE